MTIYFLIVQGHVDHKQEESDESHLGMSNKLMGNFA